MEAPEQKNPAEVKSPQESIEQLNKKIADLMQERHSNTLDFGLPPSTPLKLENPTNIIQPNGIPIVRFACGPQKSPTPEDDFYSAVLRGWNELSDSEKPEYLKFITLKKNAELRAAHYTTEINAGQCGACIMTVVVSRTEKGGKIHYGHVGDERIVHIQSVDPTEEKRSASSDKPTFQVLRKNTLHTPAEDPEKVKEIEKNGGCIEKNYVSHADLQKPPYNQVGFALTRALGQFESAKRGCLTDDPEVGSFPLQKGDKVAIGTDGTDGSRGPAFYLPRALKATYIDFASFFAHLSYLVERCREGEKSYCDDATLAFIQWDDVPASESEHFYIKDDAIVILYDGNGGRAVVDFCLDWDKAYFKNLEYLYAHPLQEFIRNNQIAEMKNLLVSAKTQIDSGDLIVQKAYQHMLQDRDGQGYTPLELAREKGNEQVIDLLLQAQAEMEKPFSIEELLEKPPQQITDLDLKILANRFKEGRIAEDIGKRVVTFLQSLIFFQESFLKPFTPKLFALVQYNLGLCYRLGVGVAKDVKEGLLYLRSAAGEKLAMAQNSLGHCYQFEETVKDIKQALNCYRLGADQGFVPAQLNLAGCYANGDGVVKDDKEALRLYRLAADQGNVEAQYHLGLFHADGRGVEKDFKEAVRNYRLAAQQGHAQAQRILGGCYEKGEGVEKDLKAAVRYYHSAADQGVAWAQNNIAWRYKTETGLRKDDKRAVHYYRLAAEQGLASAQCNLGGCYEEGIGVEKDIKEAVRFYRLAADLGDAPAQRNLGRCYTHGQGVGKNPDEAVRYYRLAADRDPWAQNNLGECYEEGIGVEKDLKAAANNYRLAAEKGLALARCNLGRCYAHGKGVAKDLKEAVRFYRLAAEQGHDQAQFILGKCLENGQGVERDLKEATRYYEMAAKQNHREAQFSLGCCYEKRADISQAAGQAADYRAYIYQATNYHVLAAEQGHVTAQFNLGRIYERQSNSRAVKYYQLAANQGDARAQNNLGLCYEEGRGVKKDLKAAADNYRLAADQKLALGQYNLGCCYENGAGVEKNLPAAICLYRLAAAQGLTGAQEKLDLLDPPKPGQEQAPAPGDKIKFLFSNISSSSSSSSTASSSLPSTTSPTQVSDTSLPTPSLSPSLIDKPPSSSSSTSLSFTASLSTIPSSEEEKPGNLSTTRLSLPTTPTNRIFKNALGHIVEINGNKQVERISNEGVNPIIIQIEDSHSRFENQGSSITDDLVIVRGGEKTFIDEYPGKEFLHYHYKVGASKKNVSGDDVYVRPADGRVMCVKDGQTTLYKRGEDGNFVTSTSAIPSSSSSLTFFSSAASSSTSSPSSVSTSISSNSSSSSSTSTDQSTQIQNLTTGS